MSQIKDTYDKLNDQEKQYGSFANFLDNLCMKIEDQNMMIISPFEAN